MNCTVTALYPAVVAVRAINVGPNDALLNYDVMILLQNNRYFIIFSQCLCFCSPKFQCFGPFSVCQQQ